MTTNLETTVEKNKEKLQDRLAEKQVVADGLFTQAKGVAQEKWGNLTHDRAAQVAGKKDQVIGHLQATYGNSWLVRNRGWLMGGTAVAACLVILTYFYARQGSANS
ncbi:MAG: CsbD family protein [Candidatus Promineifilaceae bacterium]|nr:CsbD family protein [Anaerolineaceae bacterium]